MSNRFHNKYHRENHHSSRTAKNTMIVDATYDPIASYEQPFQGEFFSEGEVITTTFLSAGGFVYANDGLIHNDLEVKSDLLVRGNFQVLGTTSQLDTLVYATSAASITNTGSGPALTVKQTGNHVVANFLDDNTSALFIDGRNATPGYIGSNTTSPTHRLTVNGDIRSTNIIYAGNAGNSVLWNSVYTTSVGLSSKWESVYTYVNQTSGYAVYAPPTGQLTQHYVPKATGTKANIQDSQIYDNGTSVAIGTTNVSSNNKLIVNGNIQVGLDAADVTTSGSQLLFGPGGDNTDTFSMYRYNEASDISQLRVQVGDNNSGDSFRIGATPAGVWTDWAVFTSEGLTMKNVVYTGETYSPNPVTGEITASNDFLKVKLNGVVRYIRLFDVVN